MGIRRRGFVLVAVLIVAAMILLICWTPLMANQKDDVRTAYSMSMTGRDETSSRATVAGASGGMAPEYRNASLVLCQYQGAVKVEKAEWDLSNYDWDGRYMNLTSGNITLTVYDHDDDLRFSPDDMLTMMRNDPNGTAKLWNIAIVFPDMATTSCDLSFVSQTPDLTVSFLDVGQGDSILVQTGDAKTILIDAGPSLSSMDLVNELKDRSVTVIDAFIVSHPDADHIGGAVEVLNEFTVLSVYHPGFVKDTATYRSFIKAVQAEGCPVYTDDQVDPGDYLNLTSIATVEVLNIDADAVESNDASIVLGIRSATMSFMFTGDISSDVEAKMLANSAFDLDVDVLKVSHHGSRYSTSNAFLDAVTPITAVICVGSNSYGHPHQQTLDRLIAHSVTVMRTDQSGTIVLTSDR